MCSVGVLGRVPFFEHSNYSNVLTSSVQRHHEPPQDNVTIGAWKSNTRRFGCHDGSTCRGPAFAWQNDNCIVVLWATAVRRCSAPVCVHVISVLRAQDHFTLSFPLRDFVGFYNRMCPTHGNDEAVTLHVFWFVGVCACMRNACGFHLCLKSTVVFSRGCLLHSARRRNCTNGTLRCHLLLLRFLNIILCNIKIYNIVLWATLVHYSRVGPSCVV
jgi:hypothetical protein